jgi:CBS domain containing-hemolysin-like protein
MNTKWLFSVYHFFFLVRLSSFFCLLQFAVMSYLNSRLEILLTMLSGHLAISIQVEFN